jgi:hypothetical protein
VSFNSYEYDVIAIQEVFASPPFLPCRQAHFVEHMRQLGYIHIHRSTRPSLHSVIIRRKWTDSGLLILSKFPITHWYVLSPR